jgi:hypothetical protein
VPPAEPVEEGDEGVWDTVGEPAGSRSPAPTVEELLAQLERQPPAPQGSTEPIAEEVVTTGAQEGTAPAAVAAEEAVAAGAQEEAPWMKVSSRSFRVANPLSLSTRVT